MPAAGGGDEVGESGGPSKRRRVERSAAGGEKEGQSLGVESGSGKRKERSSMSKEYLEVRCEDSQRIMKEIEDLKSELGEDLRQLGYCKENEKLRAELAVKVKEMNCLMKRIEELEAKNDILMKQTEELEAINDDLPKRNEEMQAKNDNLTKQNKELQARNDGLTKGNEELQAKNNNLYKNMADEGDCSSEGEKSKSSEELGLESSNNDEYHSFGTDDDNENDEDGSDSGESTSTESVKYQSQFNIERFSRIIEKLTDDQKILVNNCGFGSILNLKCKHMPHKLVIVQLACFYDRKTQSMKFPGTRAFKIDAKLVHWILGIPYGGDQIHRKVSQMTKSLIGEDTIPGRLAPKIVDLIGLIPDLVGDRFVKVFMLVVLSIFLCPSSATRASCHYYNGIRSVKKIKSYGWCDVVARCLNTGLSKFKLSLEKGNVNPVLSGCIFLLYIAYLDYLGSDIGIVPNTIPRINAWTDDHVALYMLRFPSFVQVEIKPLCETVFGQVCLNRKSKRASRLGGSDEAGGSGAKVAGSSSQHKPSKKLKKITKDRDSTLHGENVENVAINRDPLLNLFPGFTDSDLRIFCGDELHPEIEKHISSLAGPECSNEVLVPLKKLCLSFFRDKFLEYIHFAESNLVSSCMALVNSFMTGFQLASVQKVSADPSIQIQVDTCGHANTLASENASGH